MALRQTILAAAVAALPSIAHAVDIQTGELADVCAITVDKSPRDLRKLRTKLGEDLDAALTAPSADTIADENNARTREEAMQMYEEVRAADVQADEGDLPSLLSIVQTTVNSLRDVAIGSDIATINRQRVAVYSADGTLDFIESQMRKLVNEDGDPLEVKIDNLLTAEEAVHTQVMDVLAQLRLTDGVVCSEETGEYLIDNAGTWPTGSEVDALRPSANAEGKYDNADLPRTKKRIADEQAKEEKATAEAARATYEAGLKEVRQRTIDNMPECKDAFECREAYELTLEALDNRANEISLDVIYLDDYADMYTNPDNSGYPGYIEPQPESAIEEEPEETKEPQKKGFFKRREDK